MRKKLVTFIKKSPLVYNAYHYIGTFVISIMKIVIRPDKKIILFTSFGGRKFDDSPREIYEAMQKDERFKSHKFYWAFNDIDKFSVGNAKKVKVDSLYYFIIALKARCWITNSAIERGLNFKGKNTFYFNTWHGTPLKKMGFDLKLEDALFNNKNKMDVDVVTCQSEYEKDILSRMFDIRKDKFLNCGLPRNDVLYNYSDDVYKTIIKEKLKIPFDKKVILYAPTFRDYYKNKVGQNIARFPIDFDKWGKFIGDEYVILLRAHYDSIKDSNFQNQSNFVYDVSDYHTLNDLMIVSDVLISDYSSILFDYSIMEKPIICYTYDYEEYESKRGLYFDIREYLIGGSITEDELLELMRNFPYEKAIIKTRMFKKEFLEYYGNATEKSVDFISKQILE